MLNIWEFFERFFSQERISRLTRKFHGGWNYFNAISNYDRQMLNTGKDLTHGPIIEEKIIKWSLGFLRQFRQPRSEKFFFNFFWEKYSQGKRLPQNSNHPVSPQDVKETHIKNVKKYSIFSPSKFNVKLYLQCMYYVVYDLLGMDESKRFDTLNVDEAIKVAEKNTNSGCPLFLKKNDPFCISQTIIECKKVISLIQKKNFNIFDFSKEYIRNYIIPPFTRIQMSAKDTADVADYIQSKVRTVWPVPYVMNVFEIQFFSTMINYLKELPFTEKTYLFGCKQREIGQSVNTLRNKCNSQQSIGCIDFSQFDSCVNNDMIICFFSVFRQMIKFKGFAPKHLYTLVTLYHLSCFLLSPKKKFYRKRCGLLSGSFMTNFMGTVINLTNYCYVCISEGNPLPKKGEILAQGDDIVLIKSIFVSIEFYQIKYAELGFIVNVSKTIDSQVQQNISFLGWYWEWWSNDPVLDIETAALQLIFPEQSGLKMDGNFRVIYRAMSILLTRAGGRDVFDLIFKNDTTFLHLLQDKDAKFVYLDTDPELQIILSNITVRDFYYNGLSFC